jgi:ADP-glucose pyrophosphorylase
MAVGYAFGPNGKLIRDPTFRERGQLYLIECKSSTDRNTQEIIYHIHTIYEPLKQALQTHGTLKADIKIIPIVIRRTRTFNVKTLAENAQLVSFKEDPADTLTYKQLPRPAKKIAMGLHVHAQEWLSHIKKIS